MIHFNGGTVSLGVSFSPIGTYAGYLLLHSGNFWLALCFLTLTGTLFLIGVAAMCRYVVNFRRNKQLFPKVDWRTPARGIIRGCSEAARYDGCGTRHF